MNELVKDILYRCQDKRMDGMHIDQELFCHLIVDECMKVLEDMKGYSGVGVDGNPLDTTSWNAALEAVKCTVKYRLLEEV